MSPSMNIPIGLGYVTVENSALDVEIYVEIDHIIILACVDVIIALDEISYLALWSHI